MIKRWLKIIILFLILVSVLIIGWYMYQKLDENRDALHVSIYDYIPEEATEIFNIKKEKDLTVYSLLFPLSDTCLLSKNISYPIVICRLNHNKEVAVFKISGEQKKLLEEQFSQYPSRTIEYKKEFIHIIKLPCDSFYAYTHYRGLFIGSNNYKCIKDVLETNNAHPFAANNKYSIEIENILTDSESSFFINLKNKTLAFNYTMQTDTIKLDGHILSDSVSSPEKIKNSIYHSVIPNNLCIDSIAVLYENNLPRVKIILNKLY